MANYELTMEELSIFLKELLMENEKRVALCEYGEMKWCEPLTKLVFSACSLNDESPGIATYHALDILERYLSKDVIHYLPIEVPRREILDICIPVDLSVHVVLVAFVCVQMASRYVHEDPNRYISSENLCECLNVLGYSYTIRDVDTTERNILETLNFKICTWTIVEYAGCLAFFMRRCGFDIETLWTALLAVMKDVLPMREDINQSFKSILSSRIRDFEVVEQLAKYARHNLMLIACSLIKVCTLVHNMDGLFEGMEVLFREVLLGKFATYEKYVKAIIDCDIIFENYPI